MSHGTSTSSAGEREIVVASNRGPLSFAAEGSDGWRPEPVTGGLAVALAPALSSGRVSWISAPMTAGDRRAAAGGRDLRSGSTRVQFVPIDKITYGGYYDDVANRVLWPLLHGMLDQGAEYSLGEVVNERWPDYRNANIAFAKALAGMAGEGALVLVQDFHLMLVGCYLRLLRPDLQTVHFTHTPFCTPEEFAWLPGTVRRELMMGMASYTACGFHSTRWESNFKACCAELLGSSPTTFVEPLGVHPGDWRAMVASPQCHVAATEIDRLVGDRALIARVDRLDPAKNLVRGFEAFDRLLERAPSWRGRVVFYAHAIPSRENLPEVVAHRAEVERVVARINGRWGDGSWQPIVLELSGDRSRSFALLRRFDALLVNSVRDGMNLVAVEGALANERDGVIVLSTQAGAWDRLSPAALWVDPFDTDGTASALEAALALPHPVRRETAEAARKIAGELTTDGWFERLVEVAGDAEPARL